MLKKFHFLLTLWIFTWGGRLDAGQGADIDLEVDCAHTLGAIRPLHGSNCGPIQGGGLIDLSAYHREVGIPFTRLHDCHWPNPDVVDLHAVFPDPNADPDRPESYTFARTDEYIKAIVDVGSKVVYRLGESIEHTKTRYHVHPPASYERWAAACVGIIRHYNEGWANGSHHEIRYWEIWNEPENRPAMWSGSDEDYFRLYDVAARAIKAHDPSLKVGGPALGNPGQIVGGRFVPSEFFLKFLDYCRSHELPLDFFSWHVYTDDPLEPVARAGAVREVLDRHGFAKTELHLNEWNYLPGNDWGPMMLAGQGLARERFYGQIQGAPGAAFTACVLMGLQDSPVDVSNYYMADTQGFGLFNAHGTPQTNYYTFKAFRALLDTPARVYAVGGRPGRLAVCAGTSEDRSSVGVLISHYAPDNERVQLTIDHVPWDGPTACEIFLVDETHQFEKVRDLVLEPGKITLEQPNTPPYCVGLIKLHATSK